MSKIAAIKDIWLIYHYRLAIWHFINLKYLVGQKTEKRKKEERGRKGKAI